MKRFAEYIIDRAYAMIHNQDFQDRYRTDPSHFSRTGKLGFARTMTMCLNMLVKSLQVEVERFFRYVLSTKDTCSKQAVSQARMRIQPEAFQALFRMSAEAVIQKDAIGRENGYRFFAVDGSYVKLPQSKDIWSKYQAISGSSLPHARVSLLQDVVTGYTMDALIDTPDVDERTMFMAHLANAQAWLGEHDVVMGDRGYPSKAILSYLTQQIYKFVIRMPKSFSEEIDNNPSQDFIWNMEYKGKTYPIRIVRVNLSQTCTETLATSIMDSSMDLKVLYAKRWRVETRYNDLKNQFDLEKFSGKTCVSLMQEFFARAFYMNINAAMEAEANEIVREEDAAKRVPCKHERKVNGNVLTGSMKDQLARLLLNPSQRSRHRQMRKMVKEAARHKVDIKPGRHFVRNKRSHKRISAEPRKPI